MPVWPPGHRGTPPTMNIATLVIVVVLLLIVLRVFGLI